MCPVNPSIIYLTESPSCLCYSLLNTMDIYHLLSSSGTHPVVCGYMEVPLHELMLFSVHGRTLG